MNDDFYYLWFYLTRGGFVLAILYFSFGILFRDKIEDIIIKIKKKRK